MIKSNQVFVVLACCISLCSYTTAQPVFRYNIGGPGLFGFAPEQRSWISPANTRTSITNEVVTGSIPGFAIKTHRWAQFSFRVRIPWSNPGRYTCSLHWAETSEFFRASGKRVFNVNINGRRLNRIDVFQSVGWQKEYKRTVTGLVIRDALTISLDKVRGDPYLSAVICTRTGDLPQPGLPANFDLNIGGPSIQGFFAEKRSWLSSTNTNTAFTNENVRGSKPGFYIGTHRWAQFSYSIRVPIARPGFYFCTCFWAETSPFFREDGKRVFNVILNGRRINRVDVHGSVGFLRQYSRSIGGIYVENTLNIRLQKIKGDPFLAGISCSRD